MSHLEYNDYSAIVLEKTGAISYICDMQTYEVLYLSRECMNICGMERPEEYRHQKCYKVLQGLDAPCPFCTNNRLREGAEYRWEHYNEKFGRWFYMTDSLVPLNGRSARLEIARDVTFSKGEDWNQDQQPSMEDMLFYCLNTLSREKDLDVAVNRFLQAVGNYYRANRAYIIEFDLETQLSDNTFEWCAPGVSAEIDNLKNIPLSVMDFWIEKFKTEGEFSIASIYEDLPPDAEDRRILAAQGIESLLAAPLRRDGEVVGFVGVDDPRRSTRDLTLLRAVSGFVLEELEKRRMLRQLEEMSYVDALTGLSNRNRYSHILREYQRSAPETLGVIALDINGLKEINETHGYEYGDRVLKHTASLLQKHFPAGLCRVGSDEFVALCTDIPREEFLDRVVALRHAMDADQSIDAALGLAWSHDNDGVDVNGLLQRAFEMRLAEKQSYYHTSLTMGRPVSRDNFAGEVLREIEEGRFTVYYQPQMDLRTGAVMGAEALVRKLDEDGSIIPPGKFLPFYEVGGVISHIDLFVLRRACEALHRWQEWRRDFRIAVNFSRMTLLEPYIVDVISGICAENHVDPSSVTIEVTESVGKMDNRQLGELIGKLKESGFSISLDDFGSQYSNLSILAAMDFDEIKFDRSLISSLEENKKSRLVMESGLGLCRAMEGTSSLAEGIETEGQLEILKGCRCDYGQGYYFSRPVPAADFHDFLMRPPQAMWGGAS